MELQNTKLGLINTFEGIIVIFQWLVCECLDTKDVIHLMKTNSIIQNVLCHNYVFPYVEITNDIVDPINLLFSEWGGVKELKIEYLRLSVNDFKELIRILKEENSKLFLLFSFLPSFPFSFDFLFIRFGTSNFRTALSSSRAVQSIEASDEGAEHCQQP